MFISQAWGQTAHAGGSALGGLGAFVPLILIFIVFYFLLIRPQQKKQKNLKMKLESIGKGDKIITGGGLHAKVLRVLDDGDLQVELGDNLQVRLVRATVMEVLSSSEKKEVASKKKDIGEDTKKTKASLKKAKSHKE